MTHSVLSCFAAWWNILLSFWSFWPSFIFVSEFSIINFIINITMLWNPFLQAIISAVSLAFVFCQDRVFLPESLLRMSLTISSCPASVALQYQKRKWSIKERFQAIQLVNKLQQCCYVIKLLQGCHLQLADKLLNCRTITSCWNSL
jgi:hypothetical protein